MQVRHRSTQNSVDAWIEIPGERKMEKRGESEITLQERENDDASMWQIFAESASAGPVRKKWC